MIDSCRVPLPLIFRTISHAFFTVMRLFRPETKFCQDCFLASLIVLLAFALITLKLSRLSVVGWLLNCLRERFLLEIAVLQPSSNQGFFYTVGVWVCFRYRFYGLALPGVLFSFGFLVFFSSSFFVFEKFVSEAK